MTTGASPTLLEYNPEDIFAISSFKFTVSYPFPRSTSILQVVSGSVTRQALAIPQDLCGPIKHTSCRTALRGAALTIWDSFSFCKGGKGSCQILLINYLKSSQYNPGIWLQKGSEFFLLVENLFIY